MAKGQSLQDPFLNALRRERVPVSVYLVNGIKLQGTIESFDQFVVLLRNTVSQMVYKTPFPPLFRRATCAWARVAAMCNPMKTTRRKMTTSSNDGVVRV